VFLSCATVKTNQQASDDFDSSMAFDKNAKAMRATSRKDRYWNANDLEHSLAVLTFCEEGKVGKRRVSSSARD
jgi:hypothetical protein